MRQRVTYNNRNHFYDNIIQWFFNGKWHRDEGLPAVYCFKEKKLVAIVYHQHGKYHRTTGPATIDYKNKIKEYWYQDKQYGSLEQIQMLEACK